MAIEHDVTYKWVYGSANISVTRQIVSANGGTMDLAIPSGSYNSPSSFGLTLAKAQSIFLVSDQAVTIKSGGTNAVQSLAIGGTPTGGTFTLSFGGQTTAPIAYNATAAAVAAALNNLSSIGTGGVVVTGGPLPGTPLSCTFGGMNGIQPVALVTATLTSLTGGTPTFTATTTTAGVAPDTVIALNSGVPLVWDSAGYFAQPFAANVATLSVTNTSGVGANIRLRTLASQ